MPSAKDRQAKREWMNSIKSGKPCFDCGEIYPPRVMDWHHTGDKSFAIGADFAKYSRAKILEEIDKCIILCSNCHRMRH